MPDSTRAAPGPARPGAGRVAVAGKRPPPRDRGASTARGAGSGPSARDAELSGSRGGRAAARARRGLAPAARESSCEHEALELRQHERLDRRVGDDTVVPELARAAEGLDPLEELAQ